MQSFQDFIQSSRQKSAEGEDLDVLKRSRWVCHPRTDLEALNQSKLQCCLNMHAALDPSHIQV